MFGGSLQQQLSCAWKVKSGKDCSLMAQWYCPFKLPKEALQFFRKAGWSPWEEESLEPDAKKDLILCYLPPHKIIDETENSTSGYAKLQRLAPHGSLMNLERLSIYSQYHSDQAALESVSKIFDFLKSTDQILLPQPDPISALITLHLVNEKPEVLDAYLDLELMANLHGLPPDSNYLIRLRNVCNLDQILAHRQAARQQQQHIQQKLESRLEEASQALDASQQAKAGLEGELAQSKVQLEALEHEASTLSERNQASEQEKVRVSQQLKQTMEELESCFLKLQEQKQQTTAATEERQHIQQKLTSRLEEASQVLATSQQDKAGLEGELAQTKAQLEALDHEASTLSERNQASEQEKVRVSQQLKQTMEELESCFLELQEQKQQTTAALEELQRLQEEQEMCLAELKDSKDLISAQSAQIERAIILIKKLADMKGIRGYQPQQNSIQVMALLEAYRHSLKRAERLLTSGSAREEF